MQTALQDLQDALYSFSLRYVDVPSSGQQADVRISGEVNDLPQVNVCLVPQANWKQPFAVRPVTWAGAENMAAFDRVF